MVTLAVCLALVSLGAVVLVAGASVAGAPTAESAAMESEGGDVDSDAPGENATYEVGIHLDDDPPGTALGTVVETRYPARTETEAQRAENGTLALDWFDGDDRLERAFEERDASEESFESYRPPRAEFVDTDSADEPHGRVTVRFSANWENVTAPYEPPVTEFGEAFRASDELVVEAPGEAERHNADSTSYDRSIHTYRWALEPDREVPELVFEEGAFEPEPRGGLGPIGSAVLSWGPLLIVSAGVLSVLFVGVLLFAALLFVARSLRR